MTNKLDEILGTFTVLAGVPAFGKKYTSDKEVISDWNAGKDFKTIKGIIQGTYFSNRDADYLIKEGHSKVVIMWPTDNQWNRTEIWLTRKN